MRNALAVLIGLIFIPLVSMPINVATFFEDAIIQRTMIKMIVLQEDKAVVVIVQNVGEKPATITEIVLSTKGTTIAKHIVNETIPPKGSAKIILDNVWLGDGLYKVKLVLQGGYEVSAILVHR